MHQNFTLQLLVFPIVLYSHLENLKRLSMFQSIISFQSSWLKWRDLHSYNVFRSFLVLHALLQSNQKQNT